MVVTTVKDELKIQHASDIGQLDKIDILVYGGSGVGKTWFAGSFAEMGKVFMFDFDNGMRTLRGRDDVEYITIQETLPRPSGYKEFMKNLPLIEKMVNEGYYKTVVLDSLTTFADLVLNNVLNLANKLGGQPTFPEWGEQMRIIKGTVDRMLSWKCNIILIAHEEYNKDEISGRVLCLPLVTGKLSNRIGINFDEVYHMEVEHKDDGSEYKMMTRASRMYTAKSRLGYDDIYAPSGFKSVKKAMEK